MIQNVETMDRPTCQHNFIRAASNPEGPIEGVHGDRWLFIAGLCVKQDMMPPLRDAGLIHTKVKTQRWKVHWKK